MLNLHALVRAPLSTLLPEETITLYRSRGRENNRGQLKPLYSEGLEMTARIQSGDEQNRPADGSQRSHISRLFYLQAEAAAGERPAGIIRPLARGGDFIRRADGSWWLIESCREDFSACGWVAAEATMQIKAPEII